MEMGDIRWWHRININGVTTPGENPESQDTFDNLGLPADMTGMTVLDIGAWDGFYSFACEARGAQVTASDKFVWGKTNVWISGKNWTDDADKPHPGDAGFDYAHKHLKSKVKKLVASVEELDPKVHGKFDAVLMLGVIYHAKDPIGYLEKARAMSKGKVYIETHVDLLKLPYPAVRYYVGSELNNDATNFWGPNPAAVNGMMQDIGYRNVQERVLRTGRMIFVGDA